MNRDLFKLKASLIRSIRGESAAHMRARVKRSIKQHTEKMIKTGWTYQYGERS